MAKTIGLKQLSQKVYDLVEGLDPEMANCIGVVENAFDCIIYGGSGNGKTNFTAKLIKDLLQALPAAKCEYISYEEGHALTMQETFIHRHKMLDLVGNRLQLTDHYTYDELFKRMGRKQSAKIWVIDSIQASRFSEEQLATLKREFVLSRKKKIIIYISWEEGKLPKGAAAKSVEYYANIKLRVEKLVVFPKTRYEKNGVGNKPYIIFEPLAREKWGDDFDTVVLGKKRRKVKSPTAPKKIKETDLSPKTNPDGDTETTGS